MRIDRGKMAAEVESIADLIIGKMDRQNYIRDLERIPLRPAQRGGDRSLTNKQDLGLAL
jgi:hypothetical protein